MRKEFKTYKTPEQNELIATFTIHGFEVEHIKFAENHAGYVESRLIAARAAAAARADQQEVNLLFMIESIK